jgi:hypothetical protein
MLLNEILRKPTKVELKSRKKSFKEKGKLHYVVAGDDGKVLGYIDDAYIKKLNAKYNKKIDAKTAGKIRLKQVEYFKNKK